MYRDLTLGASGELPSGYWSVTMPADDWINTKHKSVQKRPRSWSRFITIHNHLCVEYHRYKIRSLA